ncbi:proline iminopeptidase-family hydrolase [Sphingomonas sp. 1P06PA]|uniref:proline iminopeptidase-family hydrolase n=1 Tax=Sphingomonas sp. 1P06PA TaxID=554121 RepID=UPI0039A58C71
MIVGRRETLIGLLGTIALWSEAALVAAKPEVFPRPDRELRVPVKGGSIYVRINGDLKGRRAPLVFIHGGPGGALWQFFPALDLACERPIVLYDQLDSGRSDAPGDPANWTVDRFASEIDAIRAALSLDRIHLLGHSWGGEVATCYAAGRPKGLRSLILQGTPPSAARAEASVATLLSAMPDGAGDVIARSEQAGTLDTPAYGKAAGAFYRKHIGRNPDMNRIAMTYMEGLPEDRGQALSQAMNGPYMTRFGGRLKGFDDTALLSRIMVPTLLLCGELDIMTPAATRAVLPLLRRGTFDELSGAGHMAQFDQPDAWRETIRQFTAAHDG